MFPVNEVSQVISNPQKAKMTQPVKDQPLSGPPPKGLRFNPIYMEPGSTSIDSTKDLQAGEYIKTDPTVLPVQHRKWKVPIKYKEEIEKELGEMVYQEIITK